MLLGVGGTIYNNHTLEPFQELGRDSHKAKKLASFTFCQLRCHAKQVAWTNRAISYSPYLHRNPRLSRYHDSS